MKTIKRTYFSKKLNKQVTKVYKYDKKYAKKVKANKLVLKSGKLAKNWQKILDTVPDFNEREVIRDVMRDAMSSKKALNLTDALWQARDPHNKVNTFLHNMGINFEDIIAALKRNGVDVDVAYLNDVNHWIFSKYSQGDAIIILPDGREAYFIFQYNAGFAVEVN